MALVSRSNASNRASSTGPNRLDSTACRSPICLSNDRAIRLVGGILVASTEDDPRFQHARALATEAVTTLVYGVFEPCDGTTVSVPTLARVAEDLAYHPDPSLVAMFAFALARCVRNMTNAIARERGCDTEAV